MSGVAAGAIEADGHAAGRRVVGHGGEGDDRKPVITEGRLVAQPVLESRRIGAIRDVIHRDGAVFQRLRRGPSILMPVQSVQRVVGAGQVPIQQITTPDRIEPMTFGWPAPQGRQHQQIGQKEEHAQIGAAPIHIRDHPLQRWRQGQGLPEGEHPGGSAQRIPEEAAM
ncbi:MULTISPECIES: hypothetical protein [unclassified Cyanobium]|uniref:hypothetical protein n=1 Tax=unclassified Cyanobium TaxID=2627006 RepID=UPI0020CC3357|nr:MULTISPECIES: hypothetical protein [unclassified Cyanobium]MCP9833726.1 hypothetical protein [Cyanobium sp. La Preciosa 7G6]MCP9936516.1 hypothetical protein [Cyanobium sp. Aljojuca 7A6]